MARVRVVTRTIENVVAECKVMITVGDNDAIEIENLNLGGQVEPKNALKVAQKLYNREDYKVVTVKSIHKEQQIYGMLETDFIKLAKKMNDERKFIMDDGTEVSADETENDDTNEPENVEPAEPAKEKPNKK